MNILWLIQNMTSNQQKQYKLVIEGHVQGVFFRKSSREQAIALKLNGWVKNTVNNSVTMVIQGSHDHCDRMIKWCNKGPEKAIVTKVTCIEEPLTLQKKGFEIL